MEPLEYYAYLATAVGPRDLARAAARKLVQRAARALRDPILGEREVLDAFCAEDGADLALKLAAPRASRLWADAPRRAAVREAALRVPGARARILARAEAAWRRELLVFGVPVTFGRSGEIDWHLDPLHNQSYPPGLESADEDLLKPGLDPKGPWAIARLEQALALAQGAWIADDEGAQARFAREFCAQVRQFARHNLPGFGVNWCSPMEAALRATNLALAFLMLRHRPELQDPGFALDFAALVAAHGRFVAANLEDTGAVPNNHLIADLVGLLHLGTLFPELPEAKAWRESAAAGLAREMERQVLADGFSFEASTSYHRLALELFTLAFLAAQAARVELGRSFGDRLHSMYRAVRGYLTGAGRAPQIGDNDSGRALALARREPLDHAYLLPLGAALFEDPELKPEGSSCSEEVLFLLGPEGLDRFEALPESATRPSTSLPRAGLYFLRSQEAYCAVSCGSTGQAGVGGHGHNDKLALEIHLGAQPLVVDCGTFCYSSDPALRDAFRGTAAHSTIQVDGAEQNRIPAGRLFALPDDARARALGFESAPGSERFVGEHRGFERLAAGLRHRREVILDRARRAFLIRDLLAGSGEHEVVSRFQLPDRQVRWRDASDAERRRLASLGLPWPARLLELGPYEAPRAALVPPPGLEVRLAPAWYSPGYGERVRSLAVELRVRAALPLELAVAILMQVEPERRGP